MKEHNNTVAKSFKQNLIAGIFKSWLGLSVLIVFVSFVAIGYENKIVLGALAIAMAVLFMNGLASLDTMFFGKSPKIKTTKIFKFFAHIHGEGELAGIMVGIILLAYIYIVGEQSHLHLPIYGALALAGIMAAANIASTRILPILSFIEQKTNVWISVWFGSMLSTITGAASAVFLSVYVKDRIKPGTDADVATRMAAGIGLGNGILPFVAPPIIIVWAVLQEKLGWGLMDLFLMVGIPAIIYSGYITFKIKNLLQAPTSVSNINIFSWQLFLFIVIVIANILAYDTIYVGILNMLVIAYGIYDGNNFDEKWQPVILGFLLMALEIIGHVGEPFVSWLVSVVIPESISVLFLGLLLFSITSIISGVADNALASRIFIGVVLTMSYSSSDMNYLVTSVLLGALFGGYVLIPGNIPNFPIARILQIDSGAWFKSGLKKYYTGLLLITWLVIIYYIF